MLTTEQVNSIAEAVTAKAIASAINRVTARKGNDADVTLVRKAVAKRLANTK